MVDRKELKTQDSSPRNRVRGKRKICAIPEDFLTIRPVDSPGIKKLKKLAALDSTQLENLPEDLKPKKKCFSKDTQIS